MNVLSAFNGKLLQDRSKLFFSFTSLAFRQHISIWLEKRLHDHSNWHPLGTMNSRKFCRNQAIAF